MEVNLKIVVAGPFASGKTTLITACSDGPLVGTEAPTSGSESAVKALTTVGMEFGTLRHHEEGLNVELNLFGVPGQERFRFMWDIVSVGMDGFLLLVDGSRPETWATSFEIGQYFQELSACPMVVAVNRAPDETTLEVVKKEVPLPGAFYVLFDVMDRSSAQNAVLEVLLMILEEELSESEAA